MVFERLLGERDFEGNPPLMFVAGFLYSFVSVFLAMYIHKSAASILLVGFTAIAGIPLMLRVVEFETKMLEMFPKSIVQREKKILTLYFWFFVGVVFGYTSAFLSLPLEEFNTVASFQLRELEYIQGITGSFYNEDLFWMILTNNLRVFCVGFALSFVYGTGGVFLLSWNASILSTLLAKSIKEHGIAKGALVFLSIVPHGIFEFSAYFIGGFLGALVSVIIMHEGFNKKLALDSLFLLLSALAFLVIGAWVESLNVGV